MPATPESQFASTEQVIGWMAHDSELLQNGAEIVNGHIVPSQEQFETMREEMASTFAGRLVVENVGSVEQSPLAPENDENTEGQVKSAVREALNKVMKSGLSAPPEAISQAFRSKSILPKGIDGNIASQVAKEISKGSRDRITPDQMKWLALGIAAQANARDNLNSSS